MKWYYWVKILIKIFENSYCTHYIHRLKMWATALLADFWPAVRLCIMSVLEVSTEQQRSKWWLSWKVRLELSLFPMANPCSTWTIVKCKFVLGAWNILDAPLTLCPPPSLLGSASSYGSFRAAATAQLSCLLEVTQTVGEQGRPFRDWLNWAQLLYEMAYSNLEWSLLMIH